MTVGALISTARAVPAQPTQPLSLLGNSPAEQQIRRQVRQLLQLVRRPHPATDRRGDRREPFPYPIYITPLADDGTPETGETIVVLGKHLSERGLDFYYSAPLPYRRAIASWELSNGSWLALALDLRWCRSTRHGWYENGGRFLQAVCSPMAPPNSNPPPAGADEELPAAGDWLPVVVN